MKCYRCQAENPVGASHCNSCGAHLNPNGNSWIARMLGGCLLFIFVPVGLCGGAFIVGLGSDPRYNPMVPGLSFAAGTLGVLLGIYLLRRK